MLPITGVKIVWILGTPILSLGTQNRAVARQTLVFGALK
jgi:hypothetical protein